MIIGAIGSGSRKIPGTIELREGLKQQAILNLSSTERQRRRGGMAVGERMVIRESWTSSQTSSTTSTAGRVPRIDDIIATCRAALHPTAPRAMKTHTVLQRKRETGDVRQLDYHGQLRVLHRSTSNKKATNLAVTSRGRPATTARPTTMKATTHPLAK